MITLRAIVLATTTAALCGQNDYNLDKLSAGTLGSNLSLAITAAPASVFALVMVSFNAGPTPLAPLDPRSVQVGNELSGSWLSRFTDGSGFAPVSLVLPNNPAFANLILHWQSLTLATSGPSVIGQISNRVVTQTSISGQSLLTPASLGAARAFAANLFDRNNNAGMGDVLITGGGTGSLTAATGLASTELWNFREMQITPGPTMTSARALHLAVTLNDNRVLLIGGANATGTVLSSCEIYSPITNSFVPTGSMGTARVMHAACRLANGNVMVAGGTSSLVDTTAAITNTQSSVEIYDVSTGLWSPGAAIGGRRLAPALTLLSTNLVMVSGGVEVGFFLGLPFSAVSTTAVQRWNPTTMAWSSAASMSQGRAGHHYNQVVLNDGRVLMTGGILVPNLLGAATAAPIAGAEVYNPGNNQWVTANLSTARALHTATKLADGRVVVCGGAQGTLTAAVPIDGVELFTPGTDSWSSLPPLSAPRAGHSAELLPDGTVVLFGGQNTSTTVTSIETLRL